MFPQESETAPLFPAMRRWNEAWTWKALNTYSEATDYLQVFDLQSVHVEANDVAGGGEAVAGRHHVTELGLREELLLC